MEFGPRALGNRSILGDARSPRMQSVINQRIERRESFRPFAFSVLADRAADWFDLPVESPDMLLVTPVREERRVAVADDEPGLDPAARVRKARSSIPAVTHLDHSARVQTVRADTNPAYHAMISEFERLTGCPVVVNTAVAPPGRRRGSRISAGTTWPLREGTPPRALRRREPLRRDLRLPGVQGRLPDPEQRRS